MPKSPVTGAKQHPHADRGDDCYETPPCAVEALLKAMPLPHVIWEPACGPGSIARTLRSRGHHVRATDIREYGCPESGLADFFGFDEPPCAPNGTTIQTIVTNPPFKDAQRFIEHALTLCPRVYMLGRLSWLESERRSSILENGRLARVLVFRNRLPMMHRRGWDGPKATSAIAYAWYCWREPYWNEPGPEETALERISWE